MTHFEHAKAGMARNTWKVIVSSSAGIEVQRTEVETVEEALGVLQQVMQEMANDSGSDLTLTFDDQRLDSAEL